MDADRVIGKIRLLLFIGDDKFVGYLKFVMNLL